MGAVATGSLVWVKSLLDEGAELEDRDWWSRTAWLIAVQTGDIAKAKLIREYGANVESRGRCGRPAAFYAIMCHSPEMLRWLIEEGIDIRATDEFGTTALIEAVESDDLACAGILLEAGCDVDADANGTALSRVNSRDMALQLLDAGADPGDMTCEGRRLVLGLSDSADEVLGSLSAEAFHSAHTRRFGFENPERMHVPFWEAMVKCGASAYEPRERFDAAFDSVCEPVWCAQRFGQSLTLLPDGRAILIGGEHEDYYDPDFCIYNDVIVFEKSGAFAIYGYPESVFPPTDFHTATLVGDFIYVIGSLGYQDARQYGTTPVYRLDVRTLRIDCVHCDGPTPGWIHRHRAACAGSHEIRVWGGTTSNEAKHGESVDGSRDSYVLDLRACRWRRE